MKIYLFFIFVLFATHLARQSFSNELIAIGLAEQSADAAAYDNITAHENTMYCNFSDKYGRVPYGTPHALPEDDTMRALRQEYMDLVYKIKQQKDSLGQDFDINAWLPSDVPELYTNNTNATERKHVYATAAERIKNSDSDDKIEAGIAALLATTTATAVSPAPQAQKSPSAQKQQGVKDIKKDIKQPPKPKTSVPQNKQDSVQPTAPTKQVAQDSIDELCAEFPDEPECAE